MKRLNWLLLGGTFCPPVLLLLAILLPATLWGQGVQYTHKEAGDGGTAVPYPLVTVCTSGAAYTPLPCTPKASIYSDAALTVPLANPFRGDAFGNIEFYATPAAYIVSVTAPYSPGYSFKMSASGGFAGTIQDTQVAYGTAANTLGNDGNFIWAPSEEDPPRKKLTVQGGLGVLRPYNYTNALNSTWSIDFAGHQANAATASFGAIQQKVISNTNGAVTGQFDFFVENAGTPLDVLTLSNTGASSCILNGAYVAGSSCYATIQSAITAAGTSGSVLIPAKYAGVDTYSNASGIAVLDLRGTSNDVRIWSVLSASRPTNLYPLGNDVDLFALGPADTHLRNSALQVTSSTSCTGAVQCTVTVASPTLYNVAQTGNATALFSTSAGLILEPGTAAQEVVASFTIGSGTTLVFTPANNHTQPYAIIQKGTLFLDSNGQRPAADPAGLYKFYSFSDGNGNPAFQFPLTNGAFPLNSPQFTNVWTCGVSITGVAANCNWRNASASTQFVWLNFANTAQLMNLQEVSGGALLKLANPTNTPLTLNAAASGGIVQGGGTGSVLRLMGVNTGTGTSGTIDFVNNVTDLTLKARIDTSNGNLTATGFASFGPVTVGALPAAAVGNKGFTITVSDSTAIGAEGQVCVGGGAVTALAFSTGLAWKCF